MIAYLCLTPVMGTELKLGTSCFPHMTNFYVLLPDKMDAFLPIFFDYEAAMRYVDQDHTKLQLIKYPFKEPPEKEVKSGYANSQIQKNHKRKTSRTQNNKTTTGNNH